MVVDAQVHLWSTGAPTALHRRGRTFLAPELLGEMDAAGVDRAVVAAPLWSEDGDAALRDAQVRHADRLHVMARGREAGALRPMRLLFSSQVGRRLSADDDLGGLWAEAERTDTPVMLFASDFLPEVDRLAARHPGLRLAVDHFGFVTGATDGAAVANLSQLLNLARRPNVSVKATSAPSYSSEPYPHRGLHAPIRRVFDAFGPARMFWGSDVTRLAGTYRQCVTLFDEELDWLAGADKRLVMGEALLDWLGWSRA